jgi:hypothetical protein
VVGERDRARDAPREQAVHDAHRPAQERALVVVLAGHERHAVRGERAERVGLEQVRVHHVGTQPGHEPPQTAARREQLAQPAATARTAGVQALDGDALALEGRRQLARALEVGHVQLVPAAALAAGEHEQVLLGAADAERRDHVEDPHAARPSSSR